jgi:hypothetical protein
LPTESPPEKVEVAVVVVAVKYGPVNDEYIVEPVGAKLPTPETESMEPGVVVPMPTFPVPVILIASVAPVEPTKKARDLLLFTCTAARR